MHVCPAVLVCGQYRRNRGASGQKRKLCFSYAEPDPWETAHTLDGKGVRSMKKEELFETLSDLDPAMVKKARDYQRSQGAAWKNGRPRQPAR